MKVHMTSKVDTNKWFLSKQYPDDYNTVEIESRQEDDPQGTRRFCADGTCPIAKIWIADLIRGGVKVESYVIWSHIRCRYTPLRRRRV